MGSPCVSVTVPVMTPPFTSRSRTVSPGRYAMGRPVEKSVSVT